MADLFSALSSVIKGRAPIQQRASAAVSMGMQVILGPPPVIPNPTERVRKATGLDIIQFGSGATPNDVITQMTKGVTVYDANGNKISPLMDNVIDIGNHTLDFDMDTLQGRITPQFATEAMALNDFGGSLFSYSGR